MHCPQLSCSKMLFKQEEEIMREFGKIKMLLDTADIDEDEWDRTRGSCELLGGRLQQIRHGIISIAQFSRLFGLQNARAQRNLNSRNAKE